MRRHVIVSILTAGIVMAVAPTPPALAHNKGTHEWYIAGPPFGPNVTQAPDGHRLEVEGSGALFVGNSATSIVGGGPYRLIDRAGKQIRRGTWETDGIAKYFDQGELMPLALVDPGYRRGVIVAPVSFGRLGKGTITIYCASGDAETEGFRVRLARRSFQTIVVGSTIFRHNDRSGVPGPV